MRQALFKTCAWGRENDYDGRLALTIVSLSVVLLPQGAASPLSQANGSTEFDFGRSVAARRTRRSARV